MARVAMPRFFRVLAWLVFLAALVWVGRKVPWQATWDALRRFPPGTLLALLALNVVILWLFALRWWWLLRVAGHPVAWGRLTAYRLAAFSVSYFTPGSQFGGEPLQVWALWRRDHIPPATALASVGLDKLLELVGNFGFLLLGAAALAHLGLLSAATRRSLPLAAGGLALLAVAYLTLVCRGMGPLRRLSPRLPRFLRRAAHHGAAAEATAANLCRRQPLLALVGLALALPTWVALWGEYALMTHGLGMHLSLTQTLVLMTAARLAFLLPLLPGGLGALEAGLVLTVGALGYGPSHGLALALVIRLRDLIVGAAGLFIAHRLGVQTLSTTAPLSLTPKNHTLEAPMKVKVQRMVCARIPTQEGTFQLCLYHNDKDDKEHLALTMGDVAGEGVLVRIHSECFTGDVLGSRRCDCGEQLHLAMERIAEEGRGVVVYLRQEGRGIGLLEKLKAYNLQDQGYDTVEANLALGHQADEREYDVGVAILRDLGVQSVRLLTNNPKKIESLEALGMLVVERVPVVATIHDDNRAYLETKARRMHHLLDMGSLTLHAQEKSNDEA